MRCRLAWSKHAASASAWHWVDAAGLTGAELIPLGDAGAFDSHICFAAATPVSHAGGERLYYMGGNGPHSGARNSSLGVATMRADGYAALTAAGAGSVFTVPLLCTGATLLATVDVYLGWHGWPRDGTVQIGMAGSGSEPSLAADKAVPLTRNGTDEPVRFEGGADFAALVGTMVTLEIRLQHASVYTVGFR